MNLRSTDFDMSLEGKSRVRKSSAAYLKEKKAEIEEEQKLGSFMLNVLHACSPRPQS